MARYLLHHRHQPASVAIVFASFKGNQAASPPRHAASCPPADTRSGARVDAGSAADAARPPFYVAQRTTVTCVSDVQIP